MYLEDLYMRFVSCLCMFDRWGYMCCEKKNKKMSLQYLDKNNVCQDYIYINLLFESTQQNIFI